MGANERSRHEGGRLANQYKAGDTMAEATVPRINLHLGQIESMVFLREETQQGIQILQSTDSFPRATPCLPHHATSSMCLGHPLMTQFDFMA